MAATYTYLGMAKEEQESWLEAMRAGVAIPSTAEYRIRDRDKGKARETKEARIKKFLALREKEIVDAAADNDKSRTLGGVLFTKGDPVSSAALKGLNGKLVHMQPDEKRAFIKKLHSMTRHGVFKRTPALKSDVETEEETEAEIETKEDKKGK